MEFEHGLLSFELEDLTPGETVTIDITYPTPIAQGVQYFKIIDDGSGNDIWIDATSLLSSDDGDNILTLTITDGGFGDDDGEANGKVSDPGGIARSTLVPAPEIISLLILTRVQQPLFRQF